MLQLEPDDDDQIEARTAHVRESLGSWSFLF
jgi:hypothetical protein